MKLFSSWSTGSPWYHFGRRDEPRKLHAAAPIFSVVYAIAPAGEEWEILGIFSRSSEARVLKGELEASKYFGVFIGRMTMEQIKRQLVKERLSVVAGSITDAVRQLRELGQASQ